MGRNSKSRKILTRSESGTCNVCSAPCSSCLHKKRGPITVKPEESSGETCQENVGNQHSVTDKSHGEIIERNCDEKGEKSKYEDGKDKEGRGEDTSCVTEGNDFNRLGNLKNKNLGLQHGFEELSSPKKELFESSFSEDKNEDVPSSNEKSGSKEPLILSSLKDEAFDLGSRKKAVDNNTQNESSSCKLEKETSIGKLAALEKAGLILDSEAPTDIVTDNKSNKEIEKMEPQESSDVQENNMESQSMIDSDESDILEHDVKVCDICGDAGREDKLAICSRCSDGAEHTYCMREMIDKVPEGDWFCEECKSNDEIKSKNADVASAEDNDYLNVDEKDLDSEAAKPRKKLLGKRDIDDRRSEDIEIPPDSKKQVLGLTVEIPRSSRKVSSLSRDLSSKNLSKDDELPEDSPSLRGLRQQIARKNFSKSSSFCTNVKSKSDFFNDVPQKQKSTREYKEGSSKLIGRSMSFKPPSSSSRLNSSESKVKMLSSNFHHPQDVKGLRKSQSTLERKSSFKAEASMRNNADQKLALSDPIVSNNSEFKGVVANSKPSILSKSTSYTARKGEIKTNVSDKSLKEIGLRDESSSGSHATDKSACKSKGGLLGTVPRTSIDSPRDVVNGASATRSSEDVIKGNKLKAAIEAAMLKKPGICRKNKPADPSDGLAMPSNNINSETRTDENLSNPSKRNITSIANEAIEEQAISSNGNQISLPISLQNTVTLPVTVKTPVLPEHEFIWQGGFEIRKIGKLANSRDGLQAHLSTFASPKVREMVNTFSSKLLLNEVPRSSTWPVQFQDSGVKEENIALYFFAKDLDSYERSYKSLVETMMRRDVALKGNFDGVDLLIFPSNHLPRNAQRWNMIYFLWGVFRKNKVSLQNVPDSSAFNASKQSECPTTVDLQGILRNPNASKSSAVVYEGHRSENVKGINDTKVSLDDAEKKDSTVPQEQNADVTTKIKPHVVKSQPSVLDAKTILSSTRQNSSSSGTSAKVFPSNDLETLERTVKEEEKTTEASAFRDTNMAFNRAAKEPCEGNLSHGKSRHEFPISLNLTSSLLTEEGESANKKQKMVEEKTTDASASRETNMAFNKATKEPSEGNLSHGKNLHEFPISLNLTSSLLTEEGETANKKQKMDSSVTGSSDNVHATDGETNAPKRGFELDLNEAQDYSPDSPSPAAKPVKGFFFDLNVAQDYPPDNDEVGESSSLSPHFEVMPASNVEPVLPVRPNTRSARLFFDSLSKP